MIKISVVIITMNEERNIGRCLASVKGIADELLVVDSGSTDNTQKIAETAGAQFYIHPFEGHIEQKNYALSKASFPYVLSLDADEALSEELRTSILKVKQQWQYDGYTMNRITNYCGTWIKHSGWYPDTKLRLIHRDKGKWGGTNPHDKLELFSKTETFRLNGDILHYSYYSVQEHRDRSVNYANIAAQALYKKGKKCVYIKPYLSAGAKFVKSFFISLGFLDGIQGWRICTIESKASFMKYKKLRALWKIERVNKRFGEEKSMGL